MWDSRSDPRAFIKYTCNIIVGIYPTLRCARTIDIGNCKFGSFKNKFTKGSVRKEISQMKNIKMMFLYELIIEHLIRDF